MFNLLRIIAVEKIIVDPIDSLELAIACAYQNDKLYVYDTYGELYYQKEYFTNLEGLKSFVDADKYEWCDFTIEKGQSICRDIHDNILVEGEIIDPITTIDKNIDPISGVTTKLFYDFLKSIHKNQPESLQEIDNDYKSGELKQAIQFIIGTYPLKNLKKEDRELIVRSRLEGLDYITDQFSKYVSSYDPLKADQINYFFSRIFKLEVVGYVGF